MDHEVHHPVAVAKLVVVPRRRATVRGRLHQRAPPFPPPSQAYQETSLTKWSLRAMPAPASKVEEWVSLLKSQETTWSSV